MKAKPLVYAMRSCIVALLFSTLSNDSLNAQDEVNTERSHHFAELALVAPPDGSGVPPQFPEGDAELCGKLLRNFNLSIDVSWRGLELFRSAYGQQVMISGFAFEMKTETLLEDLANVGFHQTKLLEPSFERMWIHVSAARRETDSGLSASELAKRLEISNPFLENRIEQLRQSILMINSLESEKKALDGDAERLTQAISKMYYALSPLRKAERNKADGLAFTTPELAEFISWYGRAWMFAFGPGDNGMNDTRAIEQRVTLLTPVVKVRLEALTSR